MSNTQPKLFDPLQAGSMPADVNAERLVLASLLLDPAHLDTSRDLIAPADFSSDYNKRILTKIFAMHDAGLKVDRVSLASSMHETGQLDSIGGLAYLVDLEEGMPRLSNLEGWIQIVRQKAVKRRAILQCHDTMLRLTQTDEDAVEVFSQAEQALSSLAGELTTAPAFRTPAEIIRGAGGTDRYLQRRAESGIPTPFPTLNRMTGGLRQGELIVIAAHTGAGKTAMALNFASHAASRGRAGAIFSLEMDAEQINDRIICVRSGLNSQWLRNADPSTFESERRSTVSRAIAAVGEMPIYISDGTKFTVPSMLAELRRLLTKQKLDFVIVDYIQLTQSVGRFSNRAEEIGSITRGLKRLASELRVPVIALSQFNRESAKDNREPQLHDLFSSSSIEQDSSLVLMIHFTRPYDVNAGVDTGDVKLLVRKQRNGPTGWIPLVFDAPSGRFYEPDNTQ